MSNDTPAAIPSAIFGPCFRENWENVRHIKTERISFLNAYSLISAGVLTLVQNVRGSALLELSLLCSCVSSPWSGY